jgi:hypothetical protein
MTMLRRTITTGLLATAATGSLMAMAPAAPAATGVDDNRIQGASVRATAEDDQVRARGTITFRSERYNLSERAVVSTTPTTIRIFDDSATTKQGGKTSLYVRLGYTLDANTTVLRVNGGEAIRGYDFARGTYDPAQFMPLGQGALSIDSPDWSGATHAWGHLNSPQERGIDLDVHGVHFG